MFEVTLLFLVVLLFAACAFLPLDCNELISQQSVSDSCPDSELRTLEDSALKPPFLTHLRGEIESALWPRPTDSVLQRHYDALVSAELENRLATMPDS